MFRFAIMGAGNIAAHFVKAMPLTGCEAIAIASKSINRAQDFAVRNGIPAAYDDYAEMLEKEHPDAVYIAVTQNDHARLTDLCVSHRIPVLCEKAMFLSSREATDVFTHAEKAGVFTMEALWTRFLPTIQRVRTWLENGEIGEVALAEFGIGFQAPLDFSNRYFNPALFGGAMYDLTVYGYEILTWLFGEDVQVRHVSAIRGESGVDVTDIVELRKDNTPLLIRTSFMTPIEERMVIYGTKGKIVVPGPHVAMQADLYGLDSQLREHFADEVTQHGFVYEIQETVRCVQEKSVESRVVPHASTLACARLFDLLQASLPGT